MARRRFEIIIKPTSSPYQRFSFVLLIMKYTQSLIQLIYILTHRGIKLQKHFRWTNGEIQIIENTEPKSCFLMKLKSVNLTELPNEAPANKNSFRVDLHVGLQCVQLGPSIMPPPSMLLSRRPSHRNSTREVGPFPVGHVIDRQEALDHFEQHFIVSSRGSRNFHQVCQNYKAQNTQHIYCRSMITCKYVEHLPAPQIHH